MLIKCTVYNTKQNDWPIELNWWAISGLANYICCISVSKEFIMQRTMSLYYVMIFLLRQELDLQLVFEKYGT